jgi:hypothetical protein
MIDFCPVGCDGTETRKRQHRLVMALRRRPRPRRGLIAREGVMAVNAFAGAWYAIRTPTVSTPRRAP